MAMTKLVGIINLTPDSFSGDGVGNGVAETLAKIDTMIEHGADVIDIGAESTRPTATLLSSDEEWQRLEPVLQQLGHRYHHTVVSVDTRHVDVAAKAIALGVHWINDVGGCKDDAMLGFAKKTGCTLVVMHSISIPPSHEQVIPAHLDPIDVLMNWGQDILTRADALGLNHSQLILDPGIGFGKTPSQSFTILKRCKELQALGLPILIGHSRKSFLSLFTSKEASLRDPETLAVSYYLLQQHVDYLRVHNIPDHLALVRIHEALHATP